MEEHVSRVTLWINEIFGQYALRLFHALHVQPKEYEHPIPEYVVMSLLVFLLCTILALILKSRLSVERPGAFQQCAEMLLTNPLEFGIKDLLDENVGHGAEKFIPFVGTISIFVLFSNLMSVFPGFSSPTGIVVVPLGCAVLTFIYFNYHGIRHHGTVGYLKTFAGPVWWLGWLIGPVEMLSATARILSLTVRLWANIFSSDLIYMVFLGLLLAPVEWGWGKSPALGVFFAIFPAIIPFVFVGLHLFVSIIQAYIFTVLPSIYLGQALAEEH